MKHLRLVIFNCQEFCRAWNEFCPHFPLTSVGTAFQWRFLEKIGSIQIKPKRKKGFIVFFLWIHGDSLLCALFAKKRKKGGKEGGLDLVTFYLNLIQINSNAIKSNSIRDVSAICYEDDLICTIAPPSCKMKRTSSPGGSLQNRNRTFKKSIDVKFRE